MPELSVLSILEGHGSFSGSTSTAMEAAALWHYTDSGATWYGSFAYVNIRAGNFCLVAEEIDLEMAYVKLRRATEQINLLEGKLQQAVNEIAKLNVKQTEDSKLLCDQLTETLQQLASQTEQAEEDKKFFKEMLGKNSKDLDGFSCLLCHLSTKLEDAEQRIISVRQEMLQIKQEKEEMDHSYKEQIKEKDSLIKQLEGSVDENKSRLQCTEQELKLTDDVCISLKEQVASSESEKNSLELLNKGEILEIEKLCQDNEDLKELLNSFMVKVTELDKEHASVSNHLSRLISSFEGFYELSQVEKMLMQKLLQETVKLESDNQELLDQIQCMKKEASNNAESLQGEITKRDQQVNTLENQINQLRSVLDEKEQLYRCSVGREKTLEDQKLKIEGEKIELSKHLKALRLQNDQTINDICKKYELEKVEITNAEKEKAEKLIREIENKYSEKEKEHSTMVARIHQDNERKKSILWAYHKEELQHADIELKERLSLLKKEHENQMKLLRMDHAEECQRMQAELELQQSKVEKQRALLQSQQDDREVNSKKVLSTHQVWKDDNIWDKRQILYVLVLTTTVGLVFLLRPLLPIWMIWLIAAIWGAGSIGLPFGLYGTTRCERDFSRHIGRLVYTLFSVLVIYAFYLVAVRTEDTSASTAPSSLKESAADTNSDSWWTAGWFCLIGLIVLVCNIGSSIRGCWTGGDRDP